MLLNRDKILLKYEFKPVARLGLYENDFDIFKKEVKKLGLVYLIKKSGIHYNRDKTLVAYVSFSKDLAKKCCEAESRDDIFELGTLLGYPTCCVKKFVKDFNRYKNHEDYTILSTKNTKGKPHFFCNNIFCFETKLRDDFLEEYKKNYDIFGKYTDLSFIDYIPCSYGCKKTIENVNKLKDILNEVSPHTFSMLKNALKRPVLYFDYLRWVVFDGDVKGRKIYYRDTMPFNSLVPEKTKILIRSGDNVEVSDENISVFKEESKIGEIKKENKYDGFLLDFS